MRSSKLPPIGLYHPTNREKYLGDHVPIYRSSWEHRVMYFLDNNPGIIKWGSEMVQIPYISPIDGKMHRYFVDFYAETVGVNGPKRFLIEVKPKKQLEPPKTKNRSRKTVLTEMTQFVVNKAKFEAAEKYAQKYGYGWYIFTEDDIEMHCN